MSKSGPSNSESATYSSWWFTLGYSIRVFVLSILLQLHQLLRLIPLLPLVLGSRRQSPNSKISASYGNRTIWTRLTWDLVEVILAYLWVLTKKSSSFVFFHVLFPKLSFLRRQNKMSRRWKNLLSEHRVHQLTWKIMVVQNRLV